MPDEGKVILLNGKRGTFETSKVLLIHTLFLPSRSSRIVHLSFPEAIDESKKVERRRTGGTGVNSRNATNRCTEYGRIDASRGG